MTGNKEKEREGMKGRERDVEWRKREESEVKEMKSYYLLFFDHFGAITVWAVRHVICLFCAPNDVH